MTLRISRLRIANFRNFAECEVSSFPSPAVIVGENGIGKSNMLHALRLVLDPDMPDSARRLRAEDIHEGATGPFGPGLAGGAEVAVEIDFEGFDDEPDALAILSDALTKVTRPRRARLVYRFAPRAPLDIEGPPTEEDVAFTPLDYDFQVTQGIDESTDGARVRRYISLRVLPALRDAESDLARWNRSPLRTLLEELPLDRTKLEAIAGDIDAAADRLAQEPEIDGLQKDLATRLKRLVGPQLPVDPHVGIASKDPDSLLRSLRLFVDSSRTRTVADTSLGAANVLYLGMLMEALSVRRSASAFVTTILGVEEPEAHLHVAVQRRLFRHLLATEPAMLLTTHSPHIAAVAPLDSLLLLRASTSGTVASTTLDAGLTAEESQDISRYLDVTRAELLFARFVILVEGTAETYILPAIAKAAGFDLDEYGVVVVNVAGTDFAPYRKLLGPLGLQVPHVVITDGDPLRDSKRSEQGLQRAAQLVEDASLRERLISDVEELRQHERAGANGKAIRLRRSLQDACAEAGLFVGDSTLELDLLFLLGDELATAYSELASEGRSTAMARDIRAILEAEGTEEMITEPTQYLADMARAENTARSTHQHRLDRVLARVEELGKGRVAQRWAHHIEKANLRNWLEVLLAGLGHQTDSNISDVSQEVHLDLIASSESARVYLRALDHVSRAARSSALIRAEEP
ncbi:AAA family ATPase [Brevibacterium sp. SMBL_HHYL_HB1]|uniref:ATP-dependent nuclease n=1 Tax=Brevibacterium sp. SMBL_HHYL_HB1 TaxID=2777556 RepID=UPI001BA7313A|nr:AAA family ATPase [Brevibacterium sp. SMBL_HHYL_HB1]QUL78048.1 AAA family ATPase [Brevibacterium sp. SMBL_HHYL_HB1]